MLEPSGDNPGVERRSKPRTSTKTNAILAGVLVVLACFAYWYELKQKPAMQKAADEKTKLFAFDQRREVESVSLTDKIYKLDAFFSCKTNCKLNEPNQVWEIERPVSFRADDTALGSFITAVSNAVVAESIPIEGDQEKTLGAYGMSKDMRGLKNVQFKFKDNSQPYEVYFGDTTPVGENLYVWVAGPGVNSSTVRIIPTYVRDYLKRGLSYWRSKKIFNFATSEIERFSLKNVSGSMEFKKEKGEWHYKDGKPADNEAIDTFLTGVVFLNAKDYASDQKQKDASKLGIAGAPTSELQVFTDKAPLGTKLSLYDLKVGKASKIYGTVSNTNFVVEFDRASIDKFAKKSSSFRLKALLTAADKSQVAQLDLVLLGEERFSFTTTDHQTWQLKAGKIEGYDPASVEKAFEKVGSARVAEFSDLKQVPSKASELSAWTFKDKQGKIIRSFKVFGDTQKGEYFAKFENGELASLERANAAHIPFRLTEFQRIPEKK